MKAEGDSDRERLDDAKRKVAQRFGWQQVHDSKEKGFFARDSAGVIHWLKARTEVPGRESTSWDSIKSDRPYAMLVGILVARSATSEANITLVVRAPKETVEDLKSNKDSNNPRFRWDDEARAAVEYLWRSDD